VVKESLLGGQVGPTGLGLPPELCHHAANLSLDEQKTISQHRQDHANDHWHWELA